MPLCSRIEIFHHFCYLNYFSCFSLALPEVPAIEYYIYA